MTKQLSLYQQGTFPVEFQGKVYNVTAFDLPGRSVYRIDFEKTCLFLTKFEAATGGRYWTAVPEDTKINHIVQQLGTIIENKIA